MNKKILILLLALIVLSVNVFARESFLLRDSAARLELTKVDPSPLKPGSVADIFFDITNVDSKDLNDVRISVIQIYPFSSDIGSHNEVSFAKLSPGEKVTFKLRMRVNQDVPEGTYPLSVQYYSEKAGTYSNYNYNLDVLKSPGGVFVDTITLNPEKVAPGSSVTVTVKLTNSFDYGMKDITLKLDIKSSDTPFAPVGATAERKISEIQPGKSAEVDFVIVPLPSTESNIYKVPLNVQYYDELGKLYNKTELISIIVWDKPEIVASIKETEITSSLKTGNVLFNIVNKGLTNIKLLSVTLQPSADYEILSASSIYVGSLDSDDDETAEFKVKIKSKEKEVPMPVVLEYRDTNNEKYNQEEDIVLRVYSNKELGNGNGTWVWVLVILVVAGAAGYYLYKKQHKK